MLKYLKSCLFLLICLVSIPLCIAQPGKYASSSKKAIKHFEAAKLFYESKENADAEEELKKALAVDPNFADAYILLGYIYYDLKEYKPSIEAFKKVIAIDPEFYPNIYFTLASVQIGIGLYEDAYPNFRKFLTYEKLNPELVKNARQDIKNCEFALTALKNPVPFHPVNLGSQVNSAEHEYFPAITADEKTLLFTRNRRDENSMKGTQEDFYISVKENNIWGAAYNMGSPINTPYNEGAPTLSADGQVLIFTACEVLGSYGPSRQGYGSCDIFYSKLNGEKWNKPMNLGAPVNTPSWETQPSFSSDGKTLYFISSRAGGIGQADIWMCTLSEAGGWSAPVNLGMKINTPEKEESVFIHPDNQTLYFSSNGHPGMGGLDIYVARKNEKGEWGDAVNLGYPINTYGEENSLLVGAKGDIAYFASDKEGGLGGLDIYSFELPPGIRPQLVTYMKGKVFDNESKKPLEAVFELIDLETGKVAVESYSNPGTGEFLVSLPVNKNYALNVSKGGYLFYSENFSLKETGTSAKPTHKDVPLQPIKEGEKVILKNVFFATASAELEKESKAELGKLVKFLEKNPTIKIEIGGHTDNVGDKKSNIILSENRCKSVYNYLIQYKISPERLTIKGFGDAQPVADNKTPEGRALNRRTEFMVISK